MQPWQVLALLGAVILVYAYLLPRKPAPSYDDRTAATDLEETMEAFAAEIEAENKELLKVIADMKKSHEHEVTKLETKLERLEGTASELSELRHKMIGLETRLQAPVSSPIGQAVSETAVISESERVLREAVRAAQTASPASATGADAEAAAAVPDHMAEEVTVRSGIRARYAELFELYDQGKSVETIAKKLKLNKGEVQLILQLAKQEESSRV